jgi:hypothetical protein
MEVFLGTAIGMGTRTRMKVRAMGTATNLFFADVVVSRLVHQLCSICDSMAVQVNGVIPVDLTNMAKSVPEDRLRVGCQLGQRVLWSESTERRDHPRQTRKGKHRSVIRGRFIQVLSKTALALSGFRWGS